MDIWCVKFDSTTGKVVSASLYKKNSSIKEVVSELNKKENRRLIPGISFFYEDVSFELHEDDRYMHRAYASRLSPAKLQIMLIEANSLQQVADFAELDYKMFFKQEFPAVLAVVNG